MNGYSENPRFAGVNYSTMPWKVPAEEPVLLRERMNRTALLIALFFPWAIFCMLIYFSFSAYDEYPMKVYFAFGCCICCSVCLGLGSFLMKGNYKGATHQRTWHLFLSGTTLLACLVAVGLGAINYLEYIQPYRYYEDMAHYTDVDPSGNLGNSYLDAGTVTYKVGSFIKRDYAIGYKDSDIYCVTPVVFHDLPEASYDFWAVGKNCCSGYAGDFECGTKSDLTDVSYGGLRVLSYTDRKKYMVAIEQAKAAFGIHFTDPLFFSWTLDPEADVTSYRTSSVWLFTCAVVVYFCLQAAFVAIAAVFYGKDHKQEMIDEF